MKNRKLVNVPVSFDLLIELMYENYSTTGVIRTTKGIPEDAALVSTAFDSARKMVYFTFYHESLEHVPLGNVIPEILPEHQVSLYLYDDDEKAIRELRHLVQENQDFFDARLGDSSLPSVVRKLKELLPLNMRLVNEYVDLMYEEEKLTSR